MLTNSSAILCILSYLFSSQSCTGCESPPDSSILTPFDLDFHDMDLSMVLREEVKQQDQFITAETAFLLSPPSSDNEQRDNQARTRT